MRLDAKDYLKLPDRIDIKIKVKLPEKAMQVYELLEDQFLIEFDNETEISAANKAVMVNKLLQMSNGSIYIKDKDQLEVSSEVTLNDNNQW